MSDNASPFSKLRAARPRGKALSFDALSATIAAAQQSTGFVDTEMRAHLPGKATSPNSDEVATCGGSEREVENEPLNSEPVLKTASSSERSAPTAEGSSSEGRGNSISLKSSERSSSVQCNLRLPRDIRDALHLQALRERRTIADMVAEVMKEYLEARGTFERLR